MGENIVKPKKIVIIGSGIAGLSAAKAAIGQDPSADVEIISQEAHPPYYRLRLCEMIGERIPLDSFYINPLKWYTDNRIKLHLNVKALSVDSEARIVTSDRESFFYDSLVIASGSVPAMPPFVGKELKGIHTLWNIEDIASINDYLAKSRNAVVVGGGLLGLETAYRISKTGIPVTLIEGLARLLPKQLDEDGSAVFTGKVESLDIRVVTGQSVKEFKGNGCVEEVVLTDGQSIKADVVVVSVGVRPNAAICSGTGIVLDRFIPVDEKMQTGVDHIYAAGDVVSYHKQWFGLWAVAGAQGQIAGVNAAGGDIAYKEQPSPYILNTMGTRVVVIGDVSVAEDEKAEVFQDRNIETYSYVKLVFKDRHITGGILIGDAAKGFVKLQSLVKNNATKETVPISDYSLK